MFVSSEGFLPEFAPGSAEIFIGLSLLMFLVIGAFRGDSYTRTLGYLCIVVALMTVFIISFADKNTGIFFNGLFIRNSFTSFYFFRCFDAFSFIFNKITYYDLFQNIK